MFKRKGIKEKASNPLQDKLAGVIASFFLGVQNQFAQMMQQLTGGIPIRQLRIWLIGFCLLSGGFSVYLITTALINPKPTSLHIERIHAPRVIESNPMLTPDPQISDDIYHQIQQYKFYMDSLSIPIRPGLRDSMQLLEQMYLQQQNLKSYDQDR